MIGDTIGQYRLEEVLGQGTFGVVYRGAHRSMEDLQTAVKVVHARFQSDPDFRRSFTRECRLLDQLQHPNIVAFRDFVLDPPHMAVILELLKGSDLQKVLTKQGPLAPHEVRRILDQVLAGLAHAHDRSILHRDIKPGNIFRCDDGRIKILDFGVAKAVEAMADGGASTRTGHLVGTLDYMAPECFDGQATARSDLYAVGLLGYTLLTGASACPEGGLTHKLKWHMMGPPLDVRATRPDCPEALAAVLSTLAARDPANRPSSAQSARVHLSKVGSTPKAPARSAPVAPSTVEPRLHARDEVAALARELRTAPATVAPRTSSDTGPALPVAPPRTRSAPATPPTAPQTVAPRSPRPVVATPQAPAAPKTVAPGVAPPAAPRPVPHPSAPPSTRARPQPAPSPVPTSSATTPEHQEADPTEGEPTVPLALAVGVGGLGLVAAGLGWLTDQVMTEAFSRNAPASSWLVDTMQAVDSGLATPAMGSALLAGVGLMGLVGCVGLALARPGGRAFGVRGAAVVAGLSVPVLAGLVWTGGARLGDLDLAIAVATPVVGGLVAAAQRGRDTPRALAGPLAAVALCGAAAYDILSSNRAIAQAVQHASPETQKTLTAAGLSTLGMSELVLFICTVVAVALAGMGVRARRGSTMLPLLAAVGGVYLVSTTDMTESLYQGLAAVQARTKGPTTGELGDE